MAQYKKKTQEEQKKEMTELMNQLNEQVDSFIFEPEKIMEFLSFSSRFRKYSFKNRALIHGQDPRAIFVASFKRWQELKHPVNKGEKSIKIFAPVNVAYYRDQNGEVKRLYKNDKEALALIKKHNLEILNATYFKLVPVFSNNQVQLDIEDYPKLLKESIILTTKQDTSLVYKGLLSFAEKNKIPINYQKLNGLTGGYYSHQTKDITIRSDINGLSKVNILAHELAHAIMHDKNHGTLIKEDYKLTEEIKEVQAEAVATLLTGYYTKEFKEGQLHYIREYAKEMSAEERIGYIEAITDTALSMIEEVDNTILKHQEKEKGHEEPER